MELFYNTKWANFVDPIAPIDRSLCMEPDGLCPTVTPTVVVDPPTVDPPDDIIVIPVPTTGIVNPVVNEPVTTSPTIIQPNTPTPTLLNPNQGVQLPIKVTDIGDPILDSAVTPVTTPTATTQTNNSSTTWTPGMFGPSSSNSGASAGASSAAGKTGFIAKYKNYLLIAALVGTAIVIASKSKKSKK